MGILSAVYKYDSVREIKDRIRPLKHAIFGTNDFYRACEEVTRARGRESIEVIFDVGAATGDMTRTFLREYPNAMVYAIEPQPTQLARFLKRTRHGAQRITTFNCGLASKSGIATLRQYSYADASSLLPIPGVLATQGFTEVGTVEIQLRTLDAIVAETGIHRIDFLKIDVEGFEHEVLAGGKTALAMTENAYIEISPLRHEPNTRHHIAVFSAMQEAGFTYIACYGDYFFSKDPAVLKKYFP